MIVPFYNVGAYAPATLRSLARNASAEVEFILVDDGSTDATADLVAGAADWLPGARAIRHAANAGLAAARNSGLAAARGDYLTFLDGDDFVAPGYYGGLLGTIRRLGCDLIRTDHVQFRGRDRTVVRIHHGPRGVVGSPRRAILPAHQITSVDAAYAWAGIYSRRLADCGLLHFDQRLRTCEDRPWIWRLHLQAPTFAVVGLLGVFYRRNVATSLTQLADERQFDFLVAFDSIVARVLADPEADLLLPKALRSYCAIMHHQLSRRDRYPPDLANQLALRSGAALRRLPAEPLRQVLAGMGPPRGPELAALLEGG